MSRLPLDIGDAVPQAADEQARRVHPTAAARS
jgi:hypothetical protein